VGAMRWTDKEIELLKSLHSQGYLFSEIAESLCRKPAMVRHKARSLGLKVHKHRLGKWNEKHAHLREKILKYFLTRSWSEVRDHFGLTDSELKSCFTSAYRDPSLSHLRKNKRSRSSWTLKQRLTLLRNSGIRSRKWIAEKTGRSKVSYQTVKEELSRLGIGSKYVNGIPLNWFKHIAPGLEPRTIKTKAGPSAPGVDCHFVLVSWVECWRVTKHRRNIHPTYRESFRAMADFQRFVFQTKDDLKIKRELERAVRL
jgi:hypothetical protein